MDEFPAVAKSGSFGNLISDSVHGWLHRLGEQITQLEGVVPALRFSVLVDLGENLIQFVLSGFFEIFGVMEAWPVLSRGERGDQSG